MPYKQVPSEARKRVLRGADRTSTATMTEIPEEPKLREPTGDMAAASRAVGRDGR